MVQYEKEREFKAKVDNQLEKLAQSCEKAKKRVEQLKEEIASPMQGEVAAGHRERVTTLEVNHLNSADTLFFLSICKSRKRDSLCVYICSHMLCSASLISLARQEWRSKFS